MKQIAKRIVIRRLNTKVKKLLSTYNITIIAVTGSVGKTSTKIAIGETLKATKKVRYSADSYNTDIGIPLSLFGIKAPQKLWDLNAWKKIFSQINTEIADFRYDTVVIEMADDELAMMKRVQKVIKPDVAVISAVAPVHMQRMLDMNKVIHDNWAIAAAAPKIFYNADEPRFRKKAYKTGTVGFGLKFGEVKFEKINRNNKGTLKAELKIGKQKRNITTKLLGTQNLYSLLAAAAVAYDFDIPFAAICFELEQIKPVNGRMNLLSGVNNSTLIDDSYNSSSDAAIAALNTLSEFKGRKIAVLGQMNELGSHSAKEHEKVGKAAAKVADLLVTIGKDANNFLAIAATHNGLDSEQVKSFRTPYEAGHYLKNIVQKTDTVLVKGSQDGVYSEEVTRILLSPKLDPKEVLVRQSKDWRRKKKKAFAS